MLAAKATDPNPRQQKRRPIDKELNDDKFFSRLLSKEQSSMATPSFRVYYGGVAGSVPFVWESHPGTPKHSMAALFAAEESSSRSLPPLTPPPSSFRSSDERMNKVKNNPSLFGRLLVKISYRKPAGTRPMLVPVKNMDYLRRRRFSSRGSSFDSVVFSDHVDDDEHDGASRHLGRFLCFGGFGERTCRW